VKWLTLIQLARLAGLLRARRQIVSAWPETPRPLGPKIVMFMHYDSRGQVRPMLLDYLREFIASGRSVVFITNAGRLNEQAAARLKEICAAVIIRRNHGYDFGAWRDALDHLNLPLHDTEEIILANDSVFGPLAPLQGLLQKLTYETADIWGLTESWQTRYHLQSFFLAFGPAALRAEAFGKFWRKVRPVPSKAYVVKTYEVGITQAMLKAGLRCAAVWTYEGLISQCKEELVEDIMALAAARLERTDPVLVTRRAHALRIRDSMARRVAMNPTSDLWRQLLLAGFPFIKRELLRDNPTAVQDVGDWVAVVREVFGADPEPILSDLRLMLKGGAP
jgi:lipopolysaccharide biosynthesis protein